MKTIRISINGPIMPLFGISFQYTLFVNVPNTSFIRDYDLHSILLSVIQITAVL